MKWTSPQCRPLRPNKHVASQEHQNRGAHPRSGFSIAASMTLYIWAPKHMPSNFWHLIVGYSWYFSNMPIQVSISRFIDVLWPVHALTSCRLLFSITCGHTKCLGTYGNAWEFSFFSDCLKFATTYPSAYAPICGAHFDRTKFDRLVLNAVVCFNFFGMSFPLIFPECVAKGSRFTLGYPGVETRSQPSTTNVNRSRTTVVKVAWFCLWRVLQSGYVWKFQLSRSFVLHGTRGTSWHSNVFHNVSKFVLCGTRVFTSFV